MKYEFSSEITVSSDRATALIELAPPQQRPTAIRPSWVKRNTGRLLCFPSASAARMSRSQPIWSNSLRGPGLPVVDPLLDPGKILGRQKQEYPCDQSAHGGNLLW